MVAEVNRLIDAGDLRGALMTYMKDMPPEILEVVLSILLMVDQAASLRADGESLAWAESAPHSELFSGIRVPVVAMLGEQSYDDVMVPAAESIVAAIPGAIWKRCRVPSTAEEPEPMADESRRLREAHDFALSPRRGARKPSSSCETIRFIRTRQRVSRECEGFAG